MRDYIRAQWQAKAFESQDDASFALIPTTTSISRQSLLTGKYPQEIDNPFSLAKEESGFYEKAASLGYTGTQAFYGRGLDAEPGYQTQLAVIIINAIDDIMHGQLQGDVGMAQDLTLFAQDERLTTLIRRLCSTGFTVYITSDPGHLSCTGNGLTKRFGLEAETKAQRLVILKDFAEASEALLEATHAFPGTYLDKNYQYLIAREDGAFASLDRKLVTHGGVSIEEVIVPFIKIIGVK